MLNYSKNCIKTTLRGNAMFKTNNTKIYVAVQCHNEIKFWTNCRLEKIFYKIVNQTIGATTEDDKKLIAQ